MSTNIHGRRHRGITLFTGGDSMLIERALGLPTRYGLLALRISLGLVIASFGALKFFPGASPAEGLVMQTTDVLTFGLLHDRAAVLVTAGIELALGLSLLTGKFIKPCLVLMAGWLAGILSPLVLFPGELFPGGLPTLAAQYVLKDLILAAAWLVVAAEALGARMMPPASPQ